MVRVLSNKNQGRRRNPRGQGFGNRMVVQKIVTTLGTVGSNGTGSIETELACLLNPSTMKETTGSNTYGPVQIYASTYSLFSIRSLELQLKPLVGGSAVSGTVVRASWNPTSNPTQMSWSALGARKHADVTPGREGKFVLTAKDLKGPKDGWYRTNTKGEPMLSFAGSLEIHTYGETRSTYQNQKFTGGLFLAELKVVWAFKDYAQQPGLMNLLKGDSTGNTTVSTDNEGRLILETPTTSALARASRSTTTASEIIWLVTDAVVTAATHIFPPPFSWLLRGGWWFLKKIGGAPARSGTERFMIYASINDARASVPCVSTTANADPVSVGQLHFQQITPGNTGVGPDIPLTRAIDYPGQEAPTLYYATNSKMLKLGTTDRVPSACVWYNRGGGQNHSRGLGFRMDNNIIATFNVHEVNVVTNAGQVNLDQFENRIPVYLKDDGQWDVGYAVASSFKKLDTPSIWLSNVLVYITNSRPQRFANTQWNITTVEYPTTDQKVKISTTSRTSVLNMDLVQGRWYLLQYVVQGVIHGTYEVGGRVIACKGRDTVPTTTETYNPNIGDTSSGLFPTFISGIQLEPFTADQVIYSEGIHNREMDNGDLDPSFGCDDAFEFPPPPSEEDLADDEDEEDEQGASNFYEFDSDLDEDKDLEMGPEDHYSDPPISRLVVRDDAFALYEQLRATHSERAARLAVNQLFPSDEYTEFTEVYHDALADGLSPKEARAQALGL